MQDCGSPLVLRLFALGSSTALHIELNKVKEQTFADRNKYIINIKNE